MKPQTFFAVLAGVLLAAVPFAARAEVKDRGPPHSVPITRNQLSIFFGGPGSGSVTDGATNCTSDCILGVPGLLKTITLTATPMPGSSFAGWGGPVCGGTSPTCDVPLSQSARVLAYFRSSFKTVAVGGYHTCALQPTGEGMCWGRNTDGQLGIGHTSNSEGPSSIGITDAIAIAAGGYHTCALTVNGRVQCWGNNKEGEIGVGSMDDKIPTPGYVPGVTEAVAVTAGGYHTCVVQAGGTAFCWGLNGNGQLGDGTTASPRRTPVAVDRSAVGPLTNKIAAGGFHTCAIVAADSTVACWGMNNDGQLGTGDYSQQLAPGPKVQISCNPDSACGVTSLNATTIAASIGVGQLFFATLGGFHTVALDASGINWGWGNNNDAQLHAHFFSNKSRYATSIIYTDDAPTYEKIAAGAYHTCRLSLAAGVFCRGNNTDGQSGPSAPGLVPMTQGAVDLAAGGFTTCIVLGSTSATPGAVSCWGNNGDGQVSGTPTSVSVPNPTIVMGP
jgi:alpha-tubulin suppressor-like RCC1 family protein